MSKQSVETSSAAGFSASTRAGVKRRQGDFGLILAALIALFVILPLFQPGLPATADTPLHFYRALEFSQSWGGDTLYPRWAPDLAYGYGYPLWIFAPPLPYTIPVLLTGMGVPPEISFKILIILAILGYALGAYLFVRHHLGSEAGLIAAAIYTLAPFALREVLLYGGNYPQYIAIGLYPWVLWRLSRIEQQANWSNILLAALLYGAVMLSHLFHVLVLTPIAALYVLILTIHHPQFNAKKLAAAALAMALGLLWTAFFWIPAFFERVYTHSTDNVYLAVSPIFSRFLNRYELLALPRALDTRAANPWVPFSLGMGALFLASLGVIALLISTFRYTRRAADGDTGKVSSRPPHRDDRKTLLHRQGLFFLGLLGVCVFMMLPVSTPIWTTVPLLAVAEFPWRLLGLANLSLAFLGGMSVYLFKNRWQSSAGLFALAAVVIVLLTSAVYLYPPRPFVHYDDSKTGMTNYEIATRTIGTTTLGEYLPVWVKKPPVTSPPAQNMMPDETTTKPDVTTLPKGATVRVLAHATADDTYRFDSPAPFQARFFTFYYPGWTAYLDEQPVDITIEPDSGLMTVAMPAGTHTLRLVFKDTPQRTAATIVTLMTIVGIIIVSGGFAIKKLRVIPKTALETGDETAALSRPRFMPSNTAKIAGGTLIALLLLKVLLVDPHTHWFRQKSPPEQVFSAQHSLNSSLNHQIRLLGYDLNRTTACSGQTLRIVLYWQAQQAISTNYRSFVHLDTPISQHTWATSDNFHPGDATAQIDIPTSSWDTEHYIRDEHFLHIPSGAPPVDFLLKAGLYNPETGQRLQPVGTDESAVTLQKIQISPNCRFAPRPHIPIETGYRLGTSITLLGFDWDDTHARITLFWQTSRSLPGDYVVFVHLLDENHRLAWGADSPPLDGLYPTSGWYPHTIISDTHQLDLTNLTPGKYTLTIGLYHPVTMERLPVTDANGHIVKDNAIRLTEITVQ